MAENFTIRSATFLEDDEDEDEDEDDLEIVALERRGREEMRWIWDDSSLFVPTIAIVDCGFSFSLSLFLCLE